MDDFYHQFGAGYGVLQRPVYPNLEDDYVGYNQNQNAVGRNVGDRAYAALRLALRQNGQGVVPVGTNLANPLGGAIAPFTGDTRYSYFHILGGYASSSYARVGGVAQFDSSARFGSADLKELLTYWTVNNPGSLSRLEQTTGGRFDAVNGGSAATDGYDPLRGNRDLATERGGNDNLENNGLGNGLADPDAMARSMFDVRHYITPLNGARPLRSGMVPAGAKFELKTSVDERIDAVAALKKAANSTAASRDAGKLLIGYLDGLAPYASRARSYGGDPILNTLAYGGLAERALRAAAAMTANLVDSYDTDNIPSAYTLLIDNDKRNAVQSDTLRFPWWSEAGASGKLDAVDPAAPATIRLARSSANGDVVQASLGAINVYGIEAQPFVTQVVSLCMYTDAPNAVGGDDDWNSNPGPNFDPITISGGAIPADVLGQIIAFQITNPFDVDIDLSKQNSTTGSRLPDNDFTDFYLEFGGDLFKLAKVVGTGLEAVTLRAGETRVFYAMNKTEQAMLADWQNIDPSVTIDTLRKYIAAQLGVEAAPTSRRRGRPAHRRPPASDPDSADGPDFRAACGPAESPGRIDRVQEPHPSVACAQDRRGTIAESEDQRHALRPPARSGPRGGSRPPRATLDRQLSASNMSVANTQAGDETSATPLDNTGFTIVTWGSIRRHDDPAAGTGSVPLGGLPAYCVEAKWGTIPLKNVTKITTTSLTSLSKADFTGNIWSDTTFNGLITRLSGIAASDPPVLTNVIVPEITKRPDDRSGESMPSNADVPPRTFDKLYPKIAINNKKFEGAMPNGYGTVSTLRVADLLTPLGICPMTDPGIPVDPNDPGAQHLSLSEALGLALNYSSPPTSDVNWAPLYEKYGDWLTGSSDRGNLVLDRFAPFEDSSANGVFDPNSDQPRAPGIPLALNVMNIFTVTPQEMGNLTQATPGLVNINTAPPAVMQLFPLLSPTTEPGVWTTFKTSAGVASGFTVPEPSSARARATVPTSPRP